MFPAQTSGGIKLQRKWRAGGSVNEEAVCACAERESDIVNSSLAKKDEQGGKLGLYTGSIVCTLRVFITCSCGLVKINGLRLVR